MTRDELIDAGARAFYEEAYGPQFADRRMRRNLAPHINAVLDAVEPLIRADERATMLAARRYERVDLRAKVEAMEPEGLLIWRDAVLALIDGTTHD